MGGKLSPLENLRNVVKPTKILLSNRLIEKPNFFYFFLFLIIPP